MADQSSTPLPRAGTYASINSDVEAPAHAIAAGEEVAPTRPAFDRSGLTLLLSSQTSTDSSVHVPSHINEDGQSLSSGGVGGSPKHLREPPESVCNCLPMKHFLIASALISSVLVFWSAVIGFVMGVALGVVTFNLALLYFYLHTKGRLAPINRARQRRAQALLYSIVGLTVLVALWLLIRFLNAPHFVSDSFPSSCYPNALGSVPNGCVRVTREDAGGDHAKGLTPPVIQSATVGSVAELVKRWNNRQWQSRMVLHTPTFMHIVAITAFWGFVDDLSVGLSCSGASVILNAQSEQRFGTLDANVNLRRVRSLFEYVQANAHLLPAGNCSSSLPKVILSGDDDE